VSERAGSALFTYRRARIRADVGQPVWHREFYILARGLVQVDG